METEILRLHLASPLFFVPGGPGPFDFPVEPVSDTGAGSDTAVAEERIFCFKLDEDEHLSFEPNKDKLLTRPVNGNDSDETEIPKGDYLFAQKKKILNREEIISLAVEIQQEGLWQRLAPGVKLYLRFLYEDGNWVTQLFRPYAKKEI